MSPGRSGEFSRLARGIRTYESHEAFPVGTPLSVMATWLEALLEQATQPLRFAAKALRNASI